ncbi:hypothetical protein AAG570_005754 [Ranatra chinensis]|uniref:28S ribosomal protein S11, mitochondrial n=1 Tax=Ranatra chinensis TaxID=642074 RepID=A0ABD0XYC2_9HEMI
MLERFLNLYRLPGTASFAGSLVSYCLKFHLPQRCLHVSSPLSKVEDRRAILGSVPKVDEGTEGEISVAMDSLIKSRDDMFPSEDTPDMLFNGIPFKHVPICNIRVSPNNTILSISDPKNGHVKLIRSCGIEGFKNTRKGTNVAAQATAISFASNALSKGYNTVRVRVRGLGPGRLSAIKGLEMGGLKIISLTDNTPVSWWPPRPRKARKL